MLDSAYLRLTPSFRLRDLLVYFKDRVEGLPQTNSELHLCRPDGRGSKGPAAIESCKTRRSPQRPDQLLPQHVWACAMAMGFAAELDVVFELWRLRYAKLGNRQCEGLIGQPEVPTKLKIFHPMAFSPHSFWAEFIVGRLGMRLQERVAFYLALLYYLS
jgi:hypothetical protein